TALGVWSALPRLIAVRFLAGLFAVLAVIALGSEIASVPSAQLGPQVPPSTARIVAANVGGQVGGLAIGVGDVAVDDSGQALWLEVHVHNGGASEAEWSATAIVNENGREVTSDYARSTHIPSDVDPGQTVTGWIYVPVDSNSLLRGRVSVRFPDVAAAGYRTVGDIDVAVAL
ncbi:MAG TPA: hypothetical protein VEU76_06265, partial [Candidatus Udaeobacter sp.]|nr:hypothetical protein [Candidatus Udaeobacter sp.]